MANPLDPTQIPVPQQPDPMAPAAQPDAQDPRLQAALDEQNKRQLYANMLRGFQQALQGGAYGSGFKADTTMADSLDKQASAPVEQYKMEVASERAKKQDARETEKFKMEKESHGQNVQKQGMEIEKLLRDSQNEKETSDPTSNISKYAQDRVISQQQQLGQPINEAQIRSMGGKQLYATFPYLQEDLTNMWKQKQQTKDNVFREKQLEETIASRKQIAQMNIEAKKEAKNDQASEGQKSVDKDYAKQYNQFTSPNGRTAAEQSIKKMEELATEMEKDNGVIQSGGGRITSILPDAIRDRDAIRRRDSARNLANRGLKATFGAQLSDAEREAAAREFYNDALPNTENAKILRQKIADLRQNMAVEDNKAKYFEKNKTLNGFTGNGTSPAPSSDTVKMKDPNGNIRMIPKDQVEAAKAAGGQEV